MASVVIDNTVQMRLIWVQSGTPVAVNVIHGIKKTPFAGVDQGSANAIRTAITDALNTGAQRSMLGTSWGLRDVAVRDLNSPNNVEFIATGTAVLGAGTGDLLPLQTACCATLRTNKAGASYRGRFYQSGYVEGVGAAGLMTAAVKTNLEAFLNQVKTNLDGAGLTMSVASRKLGISNGVQSIVVRDLNWDTQRRRAYAGI